MDEKKRRLGVLLFDRFELLDAFGPLEMFGNIPDLLDVTIVAKKAGPVSSAQGPTVIADVGIDDCPHLDLILVPGGYGALEAVKDARLVAWLAERSGKAEITTTVCNGTTLLAAGGVLDGRRATTNKMLFKQIEKAYPTVMWVPVARWVEDEDIVTSSGVSAGIDMALHVISRLFGEDVSERLATATEYEWHRDADWDPFAQTHGLA